MTLAKEQFEEVLHFWFSSRPSSDHAAMVHQMEWWFRGDVAMAIARFGRHPHRNEVLGGQSTPEELEYLVTGQLVHTRPLPSSR
jgi:hypothetical protein